MERKEYSNASELRRDRKTVFEDAIRHDRRPYRIPILSQAWTWKACDAGYTLSEYFYDYEKRFDAVCQHHEKYEMDCYVDLGLRNSFRVANCFGKSLYEFDDETNHLNLPDYSLMDEDDYDTLVRDGQVKFYFERVIPDRYGITDKQQMIESYGKAAKEYLLMVEYNKRITDQFMNTYGIPICNKAQFMCAMDGIMGSFRGIKGLSMDMRRRPAKLMEALAMLEGGNRANIETALQDYSPTDDRYHTPLRMTCLSHTIQNSRQFEKFTWPGMKEFIDKVVSNDWIGFLYLEGDTEHITDFLQEIPAGHFVLMFEQDDPVALKKRVPNLTICGGYPTWLLHSGTPEQCVEQAKTVVEELASDGNYIFTTDKMLSYPEDGSTENMKAVIDYVKSVRL